MQILQLPQELLGRTLSFLYPEDIIRFGRTCKQAHAFVHPRNQLLWRSAFLHVFDDPKDAWSMMPESWAESLRVSIKDWDWHRELVRRLSTLRAIRSKWCADVEAPRAQEYLDTLLSILDTAKPCRTKRDILNRLIPIIDDRYIFLNMLILADVEKYRAGLEHLIHDSGTVSYMRYAGSDGNPSNSPRRPVTRSMTRSENEKNRPESASRLHVMFGLTVRDRIENRARSAARRKVYDWSLSGPDNDYGPFKRDGSGQVDWSFLEGIHSVIGFYYSIPCRTLNDPTVPNDWARVTGPWLGTYVFMDYADFFAYNTWDGQSGGARPTLDGEREACGELMTLDLQLDETLADDPRLHTALPISKDLPPLYFQGLSRAHVGLHRPAIGLRGSVSLVPGNREVRWRFIITYGGHDQWQLEGIQPGGIRSGGVFGLWSQCDHQETGPVGPFCYFPLELCKPNSVVLGGS
ncbi:hypothetical protein LTS15_005796 [Exophiala xenobiotica]|nr:hypothetical protein LTS15_005796 [Exophiala xenobiotica]